MTVWDTTKNYNNYPEPIKRLYKKIIVKLLREKKLSIEELLTELNDILKFNNQES